VAFLPPFSLCRPPVRIFCYRAGVMRVRRREAFPDFNSRLGYRDARRASRKIQKLRGAALDETFADSSRRVLIRVWQLQTLATFLIK